MSNNDTLYAVRLDNGVWYGKSDPDNAVYDAEENLAVVGEKYRNTETGQLFVCTDVDAEKNQTWALVTYPTRYVAQTWYYDTDPTTSVTSEEGTPADVSDFYVNTTDGGLFLCQARTGSGTVEDPWVQTWIRIKATAAT